MRVIVLALLLVASVASAHRGGLDRNGGHYDHRTGAYHCHRAGCNPATPPGPMRRR